MMLPAPHFLAGIVLNSVLFPSDLTAVIMLENLVSHSIRILEVGFLFCFFPESHAGFCMPFIEEKLLH